jgi:hypothetical protein
MLVGEAWRSWVHRAGVLAVIFFLAILGSSWAADETTKDYKLSGLGAYPVSDTVTSMWLSDPKGRPLLMAFFAGRPSGWQKRKWQTNSKFQKDGPGWAEFTCDVAKQRLWLDPDSGQAEVQSEKANVHESNVFLVLHVTEPPEAQKVIPLGVWLLPRSGDHPASDQLLRDNPTLQERILKEIGNGNGN